MKDISTIMKLKGNYELPLQSTLYNAIQEFPLSAYFVQYDENIVGYLNESIKKRAMTIGAAFSIGFKILVAVTYPHLEVYDYVNGSVFTENEPDWQVIESQLRFSMPDIFESLLQALQNLRNFEKVVTPKYEDFARIAGIAVSLAWIKARYDSGFYPSDMGAMLDTSETHQIMKQEVAVLLEASYKNFLDGIYAENTREPIQIIFDPTISSAKADVKAHVDIIIGETAIDLTSSEKVVDRAKPDISNVLGFYVLNKNADLFEVDTRYMIAAVGKYFARHNLLGVFTEEGSL